MTDAATRWNARVRLALAARSVDLATADMVLDEVAQHCAESGETPEEAFGPSEAYAAAVARERVPDEERAGRHWSGLTPADKVFSALAPIAVVFALTGVCLWAWQGTMLPLTPAGLTGTALTAVALSSASLTATLALSRARGAAACAATTLVSVLLAGAAFATLPTTAVVRIPAPFLCALGALLFWAVARSEPTTDADTDTDTDREDLEEGATMESRTESENWLTDLPRLLEERHGLPRDRAAELTREAAQHLASTGRAAHEEFGPVELYALRIADQETAPGPRWWMREDVLWAAAAVLTAFLLVANVVDDGEVWLTVLAAAVLVGELTMVATHLVRKRPAETSAR
ncbi:hypothetical protein ACIRFH_08025 [Streptomyces sp. NPDC093586]|uniref:hypothetical protein n=1 Tax=Streptomyces sp. NPDC093586 TaxID=3366042 RepID=UPI0037FA99CE